MKSILGALALTAAIAIPVGAQTQPIALLEQAIDETWQCVEVSLQNLHNVESAICHQSTSTAEAAVAVSQTCAGDPECRPLLLELREANDEALSLYELYLDTLEGVETPLL